MAETSAPFFVLLDATGTPGMGPLSYKPIAVDASGEPLEIQPLMLLDATNPTDLSRIKVYDGTGQETTFKPTEYQIPQTYSIHLEVSGTPGMGAPSYTPIAVDSSGEPLDFQPLMQLDPVNPYDVTKITIYDNTGAPTAYKPPEYQIPQTYSIHLEVSGTPGMGAPSYTPIAVDASGTPLTLQPVLQLDPTDPTNVIVYDNVTGSVTSYQPPIYQIPQDYSVHLEASGELGEGSLSYSPIAVDASGTPLTLQPLMQLDPTDPTNVIVYDNVTGAPTSYQPPIYWNQALAPYVPADDETGAVEEIEVTELEADGAGEEADAMPVVDVEAEEAGTSEEATSEDLVTAGLEPSGEQTVDPETVVAVEPGIDAPEPMAPSYPSEEAERLVTDGLEEAEVITSLSERASVEGSAVDEGAISVTETPPLLLTEEEAATESIPEVETVEVDDQTALEFSTDAEVEQAYKLTETIEEPVEVEVTAEPVQLEEPLAEVTEVAAVDAADSELDPDTDV